MSQEYATGEVEIRDFFLNALVAWHATPKSYLPKRWRSMQRAVCAQMVELHPVLLERRRERVRELGQALRRRRIRAVRFALSRHPSGIRPELFQPRDAPEHEPVAVPLSFDDVSGFMDEATEEDRPLLRLLTLRVLGGWSLGEIAKRDGLSIDDVAEAWSRARSFIATRQSPNSGQIISCALLDIHIFNALLRDRQLIDSLDWRTFEKVLAGILERFGYEIELQRGTKDGGIDILALRRSDVFGTHPYLVQAKRWTNIVGVEPVRELLFLQQHFGATKACLATTSTFTRGAWDLGDEYWWCLELKDFDRLRDWVSEAFPSLSKLAPPNY
jgi:hypothetical protein